MRPKELRYALRSLSEFLGEPTCSTRGAGACAKDLELDIPRDYIPSSFVGSGQPVMAWEKYAIGYGGQMKVLGPGEQIPLSFYNIPGDGYAFDI